MNIININNELCKGCGICIEFCPKQVYEKNYENKPIIKDINLCIGCLMCERRCPDFAIKVEVHNGR